MAAPMASRLLFVSLQAEGDGMAELRYRVMQNAQLRRIAIFQNDFEPAVMVDVGEGEGAAVFREVEVDRAGDFGECAVAIVGEHHIPFVAVPGVIRAD